MHRKLGHIGEQKLTQMIKIQLVSGLEIENITKLDICEGCIYGKHHRKPFSSSGEIESTQNLALIHSYLCGPMKNASLCGKRYFMNFIDDKTRYTRVFLLEYKSEAFAMLKHYKAMVEKESAQKIRVLRSDNGGEYCSKEFASFCSNHGIKQQTTVP